MPHCFVSSCNNYYGRTRGNAKIKYHMLPNTTISEKWIELCGYEKGSKAPTYARVCSIHFSPDCYQRDLQHELLGLPLRKKLRKDALPDLHLPTFTQQLVEENCESPEVLKDSKKGNKHPTSKSDDSFEKLQISDKNKKENINCVIPKSNTHEKSNKVKKNSNSLNNIENRNELSPHKLITINLDEAFKQFQTFLDSSSENCNKPLLVDKTSTPKSKQKKFLKTPEKMKKTALTKQEEAKHLKKNNCKDTTSIKSFKSIVKNNKPQLKIKLKGTCLNKRSSRMKESEGKLTGVNKITKKNNGARVSLDENLLKQILNVSKVNKTDCNVQKERRKTSEGLQSLPSKKTESKSNKISKCDDSKNDAAPNKISEKLLCRKAEQSNVKTESKQDVDHKNSDSKKMDKPKETGMEKPETIGHSMKNYRLNKLPMRSSFRIAKKKSIESLSDSFTHKINHNVDNHDLRENFADKLKFMAKLQLKFEKRDEGQTECAHFTLPTYDLKFSLERARISGRVRKRHETWVEIKIPRMPQCAILSCNNTHRRTKGGNVRYHRFPGDNNTRTRWLQVCGKTVPNCSTARVCSRHFSQDCYERDVQHELLGLPSRCRLKKGAVPDTNLPIELFQEEVLPGSAIDILLAVGLVPSQPAQKVSGGLPRDLHKMRIMEDVREGCMVQPSSPGHAELRPENELVEESSQKSNQSQNDTTPEECDQSEETSVKEEMDVKSPNVSQDNNTDSDPSISSKRKRDEEETPSKRLRADIEENFRQRDKILTEFMDIIDCDNASTEQLHMHTEQLLSEIRTLNELAREKEMEWNNIIHLKKIKEELLIRIERRKQINIMNGDKPDSDGDQEETCSKTPGQSLLRLNLSRSPRSERMDRSRLLLTKANNLETNGLFDPRQGLKNRPTLDVQSIIADYRQRHPEMVPRRGRRIRNSHNGTNGNSSFLNFTSMALGSGSQMKNNLQDMGSELNMLLHAMDASRGYGSRPSSAESSQNPQDTASFKDILVQFAKLSQNERNELLQNAMKPPPPYPEVTVHPVTTSTAPPTNSLLHGILTKTPSKVNNKTAFSPTLERLLTAPERAGNNQLIPSPSITSSLSHPSNMSISEILSTSKARNEITITPVDSQFEQTVKGQKGMANAEDDEAEDSADRLVIDESNEDARRGADNNSDTGDEVPQCQGCNQKTAQFVCAGCGNQWYCSRDCQVAAWDEHSEVCSG